MPYSPSLSRPTNSNFHQQTVYDGENGHELLPTSSRSLHPIEPLPLAYSPSFANSDFDYDLTKSSQPQNLDSTSPSHSSQRSRRLWTAITPESIPCRLYILVVVLQTLLDLAIEGVILLKFNDAAKLTNLSQNETHLPAYFGIFAFAHVFQFVLAVDAVWMRNTLQFFFLTILNFFILVYSVVQISEVRPIIPVSNNSGARGLLLIPIDVLTAIVPCIIAVAELAYIILGWSIWREFGWKVYKLLGADRRVKRMYMHYQILQCIMKFDVFFWGGFSIQLIFVVLDPRSVEFYVTVCALPASLVVLIAGHLGARYEHKPLMYAFMISCVGACGYFTFKLFRIIDQRSQAKVKPVFKTLTTFAVISIIFLLVTFTWSCIVVRNFDNGLRYHMSKNKTQSSLSRVRRERQLGSSDQASIKAKRMSID